VIGVDERYVTIEDAKEEKTKREKTRVVNVQNGPYRSGEGVRWAVR